jgi:CBS domain-containing protein
MQDVHRRLNLINILLSPTHLPGGDIMIEPVRYRPLSNIRISSQGCYLLDVLNPPAVNPDSPAILVMTDLAQVPSATITATATLDEANHSMLARGVRLLLVVSEQTRITGVVTSADVLGEKSVKVAQKLGSKHNDLRVADVMAPVETTEVLQIENVRKASVGDIVASLIADGKSHALVVGQDKNGRQVLQGIFSASQIARQLGKQIETHEIAKTFAEIETVIAG